MNLLLEGIVGSTAYGLNTPNSATKDGKPVTWDEQQRTWNQERQEQQRDENNGGGRRRRR
ncbi:hypothetical protein ACFQZZ_25390 [Nocardia sp. GCM10030253]|uniref:hypothetical protein n=1 Tax=Nocardia sp. GCM10030253 TaxID=3273404 RepID=UPI0036295A24